jgi:hypothetical protein
VLNQEKQSGKKISKKTSKQKSPVSHKSSSLSANTAAKLSKAKKLHKVSIETTQLSRSEMFDRLWETVKISLIKLVSEKLFI